MTELQRDTLAYGVVAAASAYLLIWIIPAYTPDLEAVMEKYDPSLFCLNDDARMTDEDRLRVRQFLGKLFPEKSSFEK